MQSQKKTAITVRARIEEPQRIGGKTTLVGTGKNGVRMKTVGPGLAGGRPLTGIACSGLLSRGWRLPKGVMSVTADIDIYRSAKLLIDRHGDDAVIEAAMRADKMLEQGDLDGLATWNRILRAIEELRARNGVKVLRVQMKKQTK